MKGSWRLALLSLAVDGNVQSGDCSESGPQHNINGETAVPARKKPSTENAAPPAAQSKKSAAPARKASKSKTSDATARRTKAPATTAANGSRSKQNLVIVESPA